MENKIITKTDSNLITLQYDQVTDQALAENELLIKELLFILKSEGRYISGQDVARLEAAEIVDQQVLQIVTDLQLTNLAEVPLLIDHLNNQIKAQILRVQEVGAEVELLKELSAMELEAQVSKAEELRSQQANEYQVQTEKLVATHNNEIAKYQQQIAELKADNQRLEQVSASYKQKFEGQKNRKVIKFVDKVAKR